MNTITAIIEPDADGTLHLPLPAAWRYQSIRVKAELEPIGAPREIPVESSNVALGVFRELQKEVGLTRETAAAWKEAVVEARR